MYPNQYHGYYTYVRPGFSPPVRTSLDHSMGGGRNVASQDVVFRSDDGFYIFRESLINLKFSPCYWGVDPKLDSRTRVNRFFFSNFLLLPSRNVDLATLKSPGLKVKLLVGPTCKIPHVTQKGCSGIRRSPKMCQVE